MNYQESVAYLYNLGNEIQTMKFGLETTRAVLARLGNPQNGFPCIIVSGTNGKGSAASFIQGTLVEAGFKTGLFTSPHLERIEERIRINQNDIGSEMFARHFTAVLDACLSLGLDSHPTFFELITCTALHAFSRMDVEAAVLEVGMGGRLDSTNAVEPVLSVITRIGLDHQRYLGETIDLIAAEKAGIMRRDVPAVSSPQTPEASTVLEKAALEAGTPLDFLAPDEYQVTGSREGCYRFLFGGREYQLGVPGIHQVENSALALKGLDVLRKRGWKIAPEAARAGIEGMERRGVIEIVRGEPKIVLDGGHNRDAALSLRRFLDSHFDQPLTLVFGMMKDKDIEEVASILVPAFARIVLVPVKSPRAFTTDELKRHIPEGLVAGSASEALETAESFGDMVVVAGSFYLAGEIKSIISARGKSPSTAGVEPGC